MRVKVDSEYDNKVVGGLWIFGDPRLLLRRQDSTASSSARPIILRGIRGSCVRIYDEEDWAHPESNETDSTKPPGDGSNETDSTKPPGDEDCANSADYSPSAASKPDPFDDEDWADPEEWESSRLCVWKAFEIWAHLLVFGAETDDDVICSDQCDGQSLDVEQAAVDVASPEQTIKMQPAKDCSSFATASGLDTEILTALAACGHSRKLIAASMEMAKTMLTDLGIHENSTLLYGSLSLNRCGNVSLDEAHSLHERAPYITNVSDIDFAVFVQNRRCATQLVDSLQASPSRSGPWHRMRSTSVPRFAVSQVTLLSTVGVYMDLTCIYERDAFQQFAARQAAFRQLFWLSRDRMNKAHGDIGGIAFDAYVCLLKAFAAFTTRRVITSFQAVCVGLFALQLWTKRHVQATPSGLALFHHFLSFLRVFYTGDHMPAAGTTSSFTHLIDLSSGGRMAGRLNKEFRAELYFVDVESKFQLPHDCWMNVLHNIDPINLSKAAVYGLDSWFNASNTGHVWMRIREDLEPAVSMVVD